MKLFKTIAFAFGWLGCAALASQAQPITSPSEIVSARRTEVREFDLKRLYSTRRVGDTAWSPDGRAFALVSNLSGRNNLWLVAFPSGWPQQLTFGERRQVAPAWSPDGSRIAYATDRDGDEQWDIHFVSTLDGRVTELTDSRDSAEESPEWSPDGEQIAYTVKSHGSPTYEIELIDVATRRTRRLTSRTPAGRVNYNPHWSRDGRYIAYSQGDYTGNTNSDVYVADLRTNTHKLLTEHRGDQTFLVCDWSPDGKSVLVISNARNGYDNAALIDVVSGKVTWLSELTWEVTGARFSPDGRKVVWTANIDGDVEVYVHELPGRKPRKLPLPTGINTLGGTDVTGGSQPAFSPDGRFLLFYHDGPKSPRDVWAYDFKKDGVIQITRSVPAGVRTEDMVEPCLIHYPSRDGKWRLSAFVYVPHNLERDGSTPAIVLIHGGPNDQSKNGFGRTVQYLVNRGYLVIAPNYRGSTGYGRGFHDANRMDLGGGDLEDVYGAADWILKTGYADPKKLVLLGGSYGGYLSMMGLVKDPGRWAAGVALFPFVNWFTFAKATDPAVWDYFKAKMGDPVQDKNLWEDRSPVNFLHKLRSPLFLLAGGQDPRAPNDEMLQVVRALRNRGDAVEWKLYDNEGHGFARMENELDAYGRLVEFLQKHVPTRTRRP